MRLNLIRATLLRWFGHAANRRPIVRQRRLAIEVLEARETPASIVTFTGAYQTAMVGNAYQPLEAYVTDNTGTPEPNDTVTFAVVSASNGAGGNFADTTTVTTNAFGIAVAPALTANDVAGAFTVTASAADAASPAVYELANTPGLPATITTVFGDNQNTTISSAYNDLLQAQVEDAFGNVIPGVPVTFAAPSSGATVKFNAMTTVATDALGVATSPDITANRSTGKFTVTATAAGIATPADFTLTNTAVPAAIKVSAGSNQKTSVNTSFATDLQAVVTDAAGDPVKGIDVEFVLSSSAANGTFAKTAIVATDSNGVATAPTLTANTVAGNFTVTAVVSGVKTGAAFTLTNLPLAPNTISAAAGSRQSATLGVAYTPLQAEVVDQYGNPVSGVTVTFQAPTTGATGTFAGKATITAVTGSNGIATATITANKTPGSFQVSASAAGLAAPALFDLTNSTTHSLKVVTGSSQSATTNTAFKTALEVKVLNTSNQPVAGVSITFTAPANGASGTFAASSTVVTNASGIAIAPTFTANGTAGSFSVTAALTNPVAGVAPVTFAMKNVAPAHAPRAAALPSPRSV